MQLAHEGRLDLDAPVRQYVPAYREDRPGRPRPTVGQLLSHTAGAANPLPIRWVHAAGSPSRDAALVSRLLSRHGRPRYAVGGPARYLNLHMHPR